MYNKIQTAIKFMEENLHRKLLLRDIAQHVNYSTSHLRHVFKAEIGLSPTQYLKLLRMQKAKVLAETSWLSVKEIMAEIGINDESHFVRDFKKTFGLSPTQYRAHYTGNSSDEAV